MDVSNFACFILDCFGYGGSAIFVALIPGVLMVVNISYGNHSMFDCIVILQLVGIVIVFDDLVYSFRKIQDVISKSCINLWHFFRSLHYIQDRFNAFSACVNFIQALYVFEDLTNNPMIPNEIQYLRAS